MKGRGRRPQQPWVYVVSTADELELPLLVTDSAKETAEFLGISQNGLHAHFNRDGERDRKIRGSKYEVERFLPGE